MLFFRERKQKGKKKGGKKNWKKLFYHTLKQYCFWQEKERTSFKERKEKRKKERKKERTAIPFFFTRESANNAGNWLIDFMRNPFIENQTFVYCKLKWEPVMLWDISLCGPFVRALLQKFAKGPFFCKTLLQKSLLFVGHLQLELKCYHLREPFAKEPSFCSTLLQKSPCLWGICSKKSNASAWGSLLQRLL